VKAVGVRAVLLLVSVLALGLAAVPALFPIAPRPGSLRGVVLDERGFGVPSAAVYLFDADAGRMVEEVRSGPKGDFASTLDRGRARIFVQPPAAAGLAADWARSPPDGGRLAVVLRRGRALRIRVRASDGRPVSGGEVRVHDPGADYDVVALARTDDLGRARLIVPERVTVGVVPEDATLAPRWSLDLDVPAAGLDLDLELPRSTPFRGEVRGADGPLAGILLTAWEDGPGGEWNGFDRSDVEGRFELARTSPGTLLRAVDPRGVHLPLRITFAGPPPVPLVLTLERGNPLVVRPSWDGRSSEARIWSWSPSAATWSFGERTEEGAARVPVESRFGIRADPFDPALAPIDAWDLPLQAQDLRLESPRMQ
jgi:hypothetical protein